MTPRPDTEHVCESCGYPAPQPVWQLAHIAEEHAVQAGMTPEQRRERVAGRMRRFGVMA